MSLQLWWHVYMGEVPEMCEPDETGYKAPALATVIYGESSMSPDEVKAKPDLATTATMSGEVPYVTSFDRDPSRAELDALRPEGYEPDG
jgi:hypothetical protein